MAWAAIAILLCTVLMPCQAQLVSFRNKFSLGDDEQRIMDSEKVFPFNGELTNGILVCANGYMKIGVTTAGSGYCSANSGGLGALLPSGNIIAPFWTDIDLTIDRGANSNVFYFDKYYSECPADSSTLSRISQVVQDYFHGGPFTTWFAAVATWINVLPYGKSLFGDAESATFQAILATDGINTYGVIIYGQNRMNWPRNVDDVTVGFNDGTSQLSLFMAGAPPATYGFDRVLRDGVSGIFGYRMPPTQVVNSLLDICNGPCCTPVAYFFQEMLPYTRRQMMDDDQSIVVNIDVQFPIGGQLISGLRVCANGLLTFGINDDSCPYEPPGLGNALGNRILIAPFWTDINLTYRKDHALNALYYDQYYISCASASDRLILDAIAQIVGAKTGNRDFYPAFAAVVTWAEALPFNERDSLPATFQAILTTNGTNTFTIFIYEGNSMSWIRRDRLVTVGYKTNEAMHSEAMSSLGSSYRLKFDTVLGNSGKHGLWVHSLSSPITSNSQASKCLGPCCAGQAIDLYPFFNPTNMLLDESRVVAPNVSIPINWFLSDGLTVCSHGYLSFGTHRPCTWTSPGLGGTIIGDFVVAPYWADINPATNSADADNEIYIDTYSASCQTMDGVFILGDASARIRSSIPNSGDFIATFGVVATWNEVLPYAVPFIYATKAASATFQAVVVTNGTMTYVLYLYKKNSMGWRRSFSKVTAGVSSLFTESTSWTMDSLADTLTYSFDKVILNQGNNGLAIFSLTQDVSNPQAGACIGACCTIPTTPNPPPATVDLYPFLSEIPAKTLSYSYMIDETVNIPFEGNLLTGLYYCSNGYIGVGPPSSFTCDYETSPLGTSLTTNLRTILPFWGDMNPSRGGVTAANNYFVDTHSTTCPSPGTPQILDDVSMKVNSQFPGAGYTARYAAIATHHEVVPYTTTTGSTPADSATFQVVISTDGLSSYAFFLYKQGGMLWDRSVGNVMAGINFENNPISLGMDSITGSSKYTFDQAQSNTGTNGFWIFPLTAEPVTNPNPNQCIGSCCSAA